MTKKNSLTDFTNSLAPAKPTVVYKTYWEFAAKRQDIFFKRQKGIYPYTSDPILLKHKFTNVYRASDRVSQYLIKNVIYTGNDSKREVFFRILLFKVFNKIETWEALAKEFDEITYHEYSFKKYDHVLSSLLEKKQRIFSAAYIMPSGCSSFGYSKKHRNLLKLIESMMEDKLYLKISKAKTMQEAFNMLRGYPMLGDFLAYQILIDINYSEITNFSEMDFVVPGPGARDGIRKCFESLGGLNEVEIIKYMADHQEEEFKRFGFDFKSLWGRPLKLIDCQNLFCEVSKYARLAHPEIEGLSNRKRIKQIFRSNIKPIEFWYPPKWGLNKKIGPSLKISNSFLFE